MCIDVLEDAALADNLTLLLEYLVDIGPVEGAVVDEGASDNIVDLDHRQADARLDQLLDKVLVVIDLHVLAVAYLADEGRDVSCHFVPRRQGEVENS